MKTTIVDISTRNHSAIVIGIINQIALWYSNMICWKITLYFVVFQVNSQLARGFPGKFIDKQVLTMFSCLVFFPGKISLLVFSIWDSLSSTDFSEMPSSLLMSWHVCTGLMIQDTVGKKTLQQTQIEVKWKIHMKIHIHSIKQIIFQTAFSLGFSHRKCLPHGQLMNVIIYGGVY